ncbi:YheO-like PAS domain protein [Bacillus cereus]|nr:YheO-like PAS domain protein [Bacillus cereus]WJE53688.1 PAS domain-containing protein [Bacillus cereus]
MENKEKLKRYIPLVHFIADVIGENCEVVLHDVTNPDESIIEVVNGHLSGRKVGGHLTDLALKILQEKKYIEKHFISNYKGNSKNNQTFRSSSYFIKDEHNNIIGMLCVNIDISNIIKARDWLDSMIMSNTSMNDDAEKSHPNLELDLSENLEENLDSLLSSLITGVLLECEVPPERMSPDEKMEVIKKLNDKGVFLLKGGVSEVAKHLKASEATIYRYLNKVK